MFPRNTNDKISKLEMLLVIILLVDERGTSQLDFNVSYITDNIPGEVKP